MATISDASSVLSWVPAIVSTFQLELATFLFALCVHLVLSRKWIPPALRKSKVVKGYGDRPSKFHDRADDTAIGQHAKQRGVSAETTPQTRILAQFEAAGCAEDAIKAFRELPEKTACLYNKLIDVCVRCRDIAAAERVMAEAGAANMSDVVSYNTIIKAHIQSGNLNQAQKMLKTMRSAGVEPNSRTYNELLDALIRTNAGSMWALVDDMATHGVTPNSVTTSILLKSIDAQSRASDVDRVMAVVDSMGTQMDEVLLSSVVEACVRADRADLLRRRLAQQKTTRGVDVQSAQTYGSLIRARGVLKDVAGAWDLWNEMQAKKIAPTTVTFGCMVEALVSNGSPESAYGLIRDTLRQEGTRHLVNAVVYCSVLKGLSHLKRFDQVWAIYEKMLRSKVPLSAAAYNALLDACARCGEISRAPILLEAMFTQGLEPNLITYSSILKGYCQENQIDRAFELMKHMRQSSQFQPDEVVYNTLLDGCARQALYERGMAVLEEMQLAGVRPTNYTLSVAVKLANRGRRIERCFELTEELCTKYNFRPNVHVYNNLIQACATHKDMARAFSVLKEMVCERQPVRPDARTFTLLLRGCLTTGLAEECVAAFRVAVGSDATAPGVCLQGSSLSLSAAEVMLLKLPRGSVPSEFVTEVIEGLARQCHREDCAKELLNDLHHMEGVPFDRSLPARLAARASGRDSKTVGAAAGVGATRGQRTERVPHRASGGRW